MQNKITAKSDVKLVIFLQVNKNLTYVALTFLVVYQITTHWFFIG